MKNLRKLLAHLWKKLVIVLNSFILFVISFYRAFLRPFMGNSCRFPETCSVYAKRVCVEYGPFRGIQLTTKRLFLCNPFTPVDRIYERELKEL